MRGDGEILLEGRGRHSLRRIYRDVPVALEPLEPRWLFSGFSIFGSVLPFAAIQTANSTAGLPKLSDIPDLTVNLGSTLAFQPTATGAPTLNYALTLAPAGMVINSSTGLLTFTPTIGEVGEQTGMVKVSNSLGSSSREITVNVTNWTLPVIAAPTASLVATAGGSFSYQIAATGNPAPAFSLVSGPAGLTVSSAGLINWRPPTSSPYGLQPFTVSATNLLGTATASFSIGVGPDITPPTAPVITVGPITAVDSIPLSFTATDDIGVTGYNIYNFTPAVYKGHSGRGGGYTLVSPAKYTLIGTTTASSYTVTGLAPDSTHQYAVAAFDAAGNLSGYSAVVTGTTYSQPTFYWEGAGSTQNPPLTVIANHPLTFYLFTTGNPAPSLTLVSGPDGAVYTPQMITNSQLTYVIANVAWTPTAAQTGVNYVTMQATNAVGTYTYAIPVTVLPDTPQMSLTINGGITYGAAQYATSPNTYNVVVNPAYGGPTDPQYGLSNTPFNFQVAATSNTNPTTFALVSGPDGMTLDPNTGAGAWTPTKAQAGTTTAVITAANAAGTSTLNLTFPTYFTGAPGTPAATYYTSASGAALGNPTISWTPPADTDGIAGYTVTVTDAHTNAVTTFDSPGTGTSVALSGLGQQQYFVTVTPNDASGNPGMASPAISIYGAAVQAPSWTLSSANAIVGQPLTVQFAPVGYGTYSIASGPASATIGATTDLLSWTPDTSGTAQFVVAVYTNGWGKVDATLTIPVYFASAPTTVAVAITTDPSTSAMVATATWGLPTVNAGAVAAYQVQVLVAGSPLLVLTLPASAPLSVTLSDYGVTTGSIQVTAVDSLGNLGLASSWLAF